MTKTFSIGVTGDISPYPTVVIVVNDQYRLVMYKSALLISCVILAVESQVSASDSGSSSEMKKKMQATQWTTKKIKETSFRYSIVIETLSLKKNSSNL